ncbi:MAG TPA: glyoxalase [Elusimicrobia bacterium]|nr:MAG: glyoxalase [Elusimicrobia bacterium GWF2_62_30]HBA61783.1 glyoxalase [Elusimicrobiota bacterium]
MINKINIILYVGDQAKSREFYAIILGKAPRLDVPGMTEFELSDTCILGLMPEKGIKRLLPAMPDPETAGGIPRAEVYLTVPDPEVYHVRALAAGARELSPVQPRDWGHKASYCLDRDGHVLAFAAPL